MSDQNYYNYQDDNEEETYQEQENYNTQEEEKESKNVLVPILIGLIALLGGTTAFLGYKYFSESEKVTEITVAKDAATKERDTFKSEIDQLKVEYDSLIALAGENEGLKSQLEAEKAQVIALQQQLASVQARGGSASEVNALRGELASLRNKYTKSLAEVEELKAKNQILTATVDSQTRTITSISDEKTVLSQENSSLKQDNATKAQIIDLAKKLKAYDVYAEGVNTDGGLFVKAGTERVTAKAKKADKIRIGFKLGENKVADKGDKEFYLIVKDPSGKLMTSGGSFKAADGSDVPYSSKQNAMYEGKEKNMLMYLAGKDFKSGVYNVEVYADGVSIGKSSVTLK